MQNEALVMEQSVGLPPVHFSVESGDGAPRAALRQLLQSLQVLNLDVEEAGTIELVVAEALNNICEHAYEDGASSGPIDIRCTQMRDGLHFAIIDQGLPMPDGQTPMGLPANVDVDLMDMPEGGFGWFLIKDLAKDVHYARDGDSNRLSMRVAVAMAANSA